MIIMSQNVGDALLPHGLHRNAVSQAVAFVQSGFVEEHAGEEGMARLRMYRDVREVSE